MISFIRGKIKIKRLNFIILETENIGYKIFLHQSLIEKMEVGSELEIFTYQNVREDALDLYGFIKMEELEFFEMLLSVSGIGPKSALAVMAQADVDDIAESIISGDAGLLTKVSGIGKKTAERVVLELKGKLAKLVGYEKGENFSSQSGFGDEIEALTALGYNPTEARQALSQIDKNEKNSAQRVKQALKYLSN